MITGYTQGTYPVTPNAFQTAPVAGCILAATPSNPISGGAFVTRISATGGDSLAYSTLLGGQLRDHRLRSGGGCKRQCLGDGIDRVAGFSGHH